MAQFNQTMRTILQLKRWWLEEWDPTQLRTLMHADVSLHDKITNITYNGITEVCGRFNQLHQIQVAHEGTVAEWVARDRDLEVTLHWCDHTHDRILLGVELEGEQIRSLWMGSGNPL
jgi:hypothetical protein